MKELDIEVVIAKAIEKHPGVKPRIMALPRNLWVKGSNISRMEAFGFFAFPR
jgi:hypothetical protein